MSDTVWVAKPYDGPMERGASSSTVAGALSAAWAQLHYFERPIEIIERSYGVERRVAVLSFDLNEEDG